MWGGSRDRYVAAGAIIALIGIVVMFAVRAKRRHAPAPDRAHQRTSEGEPVEDEWGKESFPASDPPQSW